MAINPYYRNCILCFRDD